MIAFYILASLLFILGVLFVLNLTPDRIAEDLCRLIIPEQSLREKAKIAQGRKKSRKMTKEFEGIRDALEATKKHRQFTLICAASLFLCIGGFTVAVFLGNVFLSPIMAIGMALIPFLYIKSSLNYYDKQIQIDLETTLSMITISYLRSKNIINAIKENISQIKPPVNHVFQKFLNRTTYISADVKAALRELKESIDNDIYREWCDGLIQCQDDQSLKDTLMPIILKLTDVRIVNNELRTMIAEPKADYIFMVMLVVGNLPLLYVLNNGWFMILFTTILGKLVVSLAFLVILVTAVYLMKFTKPIEFRK